MVSARNEKHAGTVAYISYASHRLPNHMDLSVCLYLLKMAKKFAETCTQITIKYERYNLIISKFIAHVVQH